MNKSKYIFLSYALNSELSAYANGKRIEIDEVRKISFGDSSNNTEIFLPTHFGTHIDFPYHFSSEGKKTDAFPAEYFIYSSVRYVDLQTNIIENDIINISHFKNVQLNLDTELLLINTGFGKYRYQDRYWNENPAFHPDLAEYFKKQMPNLRTIGFDTISLTGWNYRQLGKEAHKAFLIENEILLIEDMDFSRLDSTSKIEKVIVAPLRVSEVEGAPATIFAEVCGEFSNEK